MKKHIKLPSLSPSERLKFERQLEDQLLKDNQIDWPVYEYHRRTEPGRHKAKLRLWGFITIVVLALFLSLSCAVFLYFLRFWV